MSEYTSIRVRKSTRDKLNEVVQPGESLDEALSDLFMFQKDSSTTDILKANLEERALLNTYLAGKQIWRDQLKETIANNERQKALDEAEKRLRNRGG